MNLRLNLIYIIFVAIIITLLSRVYFLSIKSNTYYEELSKNNYVNRVYKPSIRGIIEDRNGEKLAVNELGFSILIRPHLRGEKNSTQLNNILDLIVENIPSLDKNKILKTYYREDSAYNHDFIKIVDYVPYDEFFTKYTLLASHPDIKIDSASKRFYPFKDIAAHVIGYTGRASKDDILKNEAARYNGIVGKSGLEKFYNDKLQGELGFRDIKVNALNETIEVIEDKNPSIDNNIKISIDIKLQEYLQTLFVDKRMEK